ncbi:DUF5682 family protein [Herbidospora sp. NBRC 101105]|uniref:DUF5682 family protein n=1 Tax=Herbidospora sp. NBRC 101105 TaxID=3032195 RepID=UPI0024A055E1|nr:DUF5682 family protein [Herbidospora sp. NBRC 101105]GLX94216.1 hypothetical protein Hesp01_21660 [Herbidospora sp. NBRC 101105]
MTITLLGVRHHGPGSARAVVAELARLKPDIVLIEGPPEADGLVGLAADPGMEPPVALLAHVPGDPTKAAFWPFAAFSPEWQALKYAAEAGIPARFCDLPAAHSLAEKETGDAGPDDPGAEGASGRDPAPDLTPAQVVRVDPIASLAAAAGYDDPERWWEDAVEHRGDTPFEVIAEAMAAVREGYTPDEREARREAYMRRTVRVAMKEGFENIAVVCGAWHVPALTVIGPAAADDRILKGLPKVKAEMTWVPWTHGRLAHWSGYGAGVTSPGWYAHLFATPDRPVERWLAAAAGVLRDEGLPVSSAHVIESVRLAQSLAVIRNRPLAGLAEVTEAARAVLCEGDELPVELIQRRMVVGERLGHVPDSTPMVPLQRHLREEQRRLRLKPEALDRELELDLRKPLDLDRSRLLHRLRLLNVPWGEPRQTRGKGTFKEAWALQWRPEFDISLIEAAPLGVTVPAAATAKIAEVAAREGAALADLTGLVERALLADLPGSLPAVLAAIGDRAAVDTDIRHLMAALPALVRAQRYGDVRGTPAEGLAVIATSLLARICAGLSAAVSGLDDDNARGMVAHIDAVTSASALLDEGRERWLGALRALADRTGLPGVVEGRIVRILFDADRLGDADARMSRAVSLAHPPARAAAWIEGFLSGGGLLLIHDPRLLAMVDDWLVGLRGDAFVEVLPLLRRTFGSFAPRERRSIASRVRSGSATEKDIEYDDERAAPAVRTVMGILGSG